MNDKQLEAILARLATLDQAVRLLARGGCHCEPPRGWYTSGTQLSYHCPGCAALISPALVNYIHPEPPPQKGGPS